MYLRSTIFESIMKKTLDSIFQIYWEITVEKMADTSK